MPASGAGQSGGAARLTPRGRAVRHDPRAVRIRVFQVPDSQERAHLRYGAGGRVNVRRPGDIRVASSSGRGGTRGVDSGACAVVPWARQPRPCRHDALHSRPDVFRRRHRADADARRRHFFSPASERRGDSSHDYRRDGGRGVCVGHSRRCLDDRVDDPHARHHPHARRRTEVRDSPGSDDLHDRDDDLRRLARLRRAAEPDHESEPGPASRRHVLHPLLRPNRRRHLSRCRAAPARAACRKPYQPRHDGRARRERRRRQVSSGVAAWRSADAGRARRGARGASPGEGAARSSGSCRRGLRWVARSSKPIFRGRSASCCSVIT